MHRSSDEHEQESPGHRAPSTVVVVLILLAAALLAHLPALRALEWLIEGDTNLAAWPGLRWLVTSWSSAPVAVLLVRLGLVLLIVFGGCLVSRGARHLGATRAGACAAGLLFVGSSAAGSVLWDGSGRALLVATIALLWLTELRRTASSHLVADVVAIFVAGYASQGAFIPAAMAILIATARPHAPAHPRRTLLAAGALVAGLLLGLLGGMRTGVPVALATPLPAVVTLADAASAAREVGRGLLEGGAGLLLHAPFLSSWRPERSPSVVLVAMTLIALLVLAHGLRSAPSRLLALGVLLAMTAPMMVAAAAPTALLPAGLALPGVALLAMALGATSEVATWAVAALLLGLQVGGLGIAGRRSDLLATAAAHPTVAIEMTRLADDDGPLERATLAAASSPLPLGQVLERELGRRVVARIEARGAPDAVLDWLARWLATRPVAAPPLVEIQARRIELLLEVRGPEAAAAALGDELPRFSDDRTYSAAVAAVMVDALHRSAQDRNFVTTVIPLVERLLEKVAANPDGATPEELQCLALLRVGQQRLIEAVTLAERAVAKAPDRAQPHLVLARIYLGRDEVEAGLREVVLARKLDPDDPAAQLLEGRLLCGSADFAEKGLTRMVAALASAPNLPGVRDEIEGGAVAAAARLCARSQPEVAGRLLEQAIAAIGRRPALVRGLATVARDRHALDQRVVLQDELFAAAPDDPLLRRELVEALRDAGYGHLLRGDRERAVSCFERALELHAPEVDGTGMRAVVEASATAVDPQHELATEAARQAFDDGVRLYAAGDKDAAVQAFRKSIEKLPLNPLAHLHLGRILLELGRAKEAEGALRTAIAIGLARDIDVEDAWPLLLKALVAQEADATKIRAAIDDYCTRYPAGRHRKVLEQLRGE